jgi:hypothetical protein
MAHDVLVSRPKETTMTIQDILSRPAPERSAPLFTFGLLTLACALASFVFACATPFAAFAVMAAAALPLSPALLVVAAAWAVNQAIGFGALHYPVDANSILWGTAMGAAALAGTAAAAAALRLSRRLNGFIALGLALVAAYAAYELALFAATPFLGDEGAFTAEIVGRLGGISVLWLIGLVAASETMRLVVPHLRRRQATQAAR